MFDIPSNPKIEKCIVTKETVLNGAPPKLVINNNREVARKNNMNKRVTTKKNVTTA